MKTKNTKLLSSKANKKYYSHSDGNFMSMDQALFAHRYLDRFAWARRWIHEVASRSHISIGCKDGYECLTLAAEGVECMGIDPSTDAIEEARLKAREAKLDNVCKFAIGFAEEMPEGIRADTVTCLEVLEHVIDPAKLLEILSRIGTFVMISTPDAKGKHGMKDSERNEEHVRLYTEEELGDFVKDYGEILELVKRDGQLCLIFRPTK